MEEYTFRGDIEGCKDNEVLRMGRIGAKELRMIASLGALKQRIPRFGHRAYLERIR